MLNKVEKPCVYHYLFSRLPQYRTEQDASSLATALSSPLVDELNLDTDEVFDRPYPDVVPLMYKGNDQSQTYMLQFWFNDILTTTLTFNRESPTEDPLVFFKRALVPNFPNPENHRLFGEMTVLVGQARDELDIVKEIITAVFGIEFNNNLPRCRFGWGTLYSVPKAECYVLLVPHPKNLLKGDTFLAFDFPMLEAIRQKLIYEEGESNKLKFHNIGKESNIKQLLSTITTKLDGRSENLPMVEEFLDKMDDCQAELYDNVYKTEAVLHSLDINIRNFVSYFEAIPVKDDSLFGPLPDNFRLTYEKIESDLRYTKLLFPSIVKRQETIQLKISLLRQRAQEQNNKIEKRQSTLLAVIGVFIGVGEVLPNMDWQLKLLWMGCAGLLAFVLVRIFDLNILRRRESR